MLEEKVSGYGKLKRWVSQRIRIPNFNTFAGSCAGLKNTSGNENSFFGYGSGYSNTTGSNNNFMGVYAGFYETGSNKLFIDNIARANEADARIKALIYGVGDAATANQRIVLNGRLLIRECPTYADNASAIAGGLVVGEVYKRAADAFLRVVI